MALNVSFPIVGSTLPTNYEYFTGDGIKQGLNTDQSYFTLNDKLVRIYSGAMHYFRVPRKYWRDRLKKIRAAGLNTVETYVPWNLHEPESGNYDFGNGGSEMEDFLHLEEFLTTAKEEDLFVILRTGPYICSEYNFGGFPSWLLREKVVGFRTSEETYMKYVTRYFNVLLTLLAAFQFTKGGPVIMFQVENEYGNFQSPDKVYLEELHQLFLKNGIVELLATSDSPIKAGTRGTLPGVFLQTANLGSIAIEKLESLEELQPGKPQMVMEFWIGWFDFWGQNHTHKNDRDTRNVLTDILSKNASFNAYMFHGGTNFGFTNGATLGNRLLDNSGYESITTSYDYDAAIDEQGGYRNKYDIIKDMIAEVNPVQTFIPDRPEHIPPVVYQNSSLQKVLPFDKLIQLNSPQVLNSKYVTAMELLDLNSNSGQSNGYIVYRKENIDLEADSSLTIEGHVCDTVLVLVNGILIAPKQLKHASDLDGFGFWKLQDSTVTLTNEKIVGATVDLIVEEMGRPNSANMIQYSQTLKGLWQGNVTINSEIVSDWKIIPLELKKQWINNLQGWEDYSPNRLGPGFYSSTLHIDGEPKDSYIDTQGWGKGMVFVNGFALGRYAAVGPQRTLYLPAPFLVEGDNEISFFEHFYVPDSGEIVYTDTQIYESVQ